MTRHDSLRRPLLWLVVGAIRAYRLVLSPLLGPACRFQPTCSAYALEALHRHGLARGGLLGLRRLARCHPWGAAGWDPVPVSDHGRGDGRAAGTAP